jgi:hypothetical protein
MGYVDENIEEDAENPDEKNTAERYKKRKRYKSKSLLCLEEQAAAGGRRGRADPLKLHGTPMDTKSEGGSAARYALFETVTKADGRVEVSLIPVDHWFSFRKPSRAAEISLDDLEIAFDQQERQRAASNKKFSKVMQAMELKGRDFAAKVGKAGEGEAGCDIAFGAPLFGPEATKALSRSSARSGEHHKFRGYMDDAGGGIARGEEDAQGDNDAECGGRECEGKGSR